jgi:adenosylcobinamide-GDP ribazoletransferase
MNSTYRSLFRDSIQRFRADWRKRTQPNPGTDPWWLQQYKEFVAAVGFLSIVPWPGSAQLFRTSEAEPRLVIGGAYFSLVGALLAFLLSLLPLILGSYLPALVLAALVLVAQIVLTGGLHLDGLMDSCDGLFSRRDTERKLAIMRDSRVGSFGVLGAVCILIIKFACYASLSAHTLPLVLLTILPSARWAMLLAVYVFPSARPNGLGYAFRQVLTLPRLLCAAIIALAFALLCAHLVGLLLWVGATVTALLVGAWITHEIGGLTGDSYGAIEEISETVAFLVIVAVGLHV